MKKMIFIAASLLVSLASANAAIIPLDDTQYWQVQNAQAQNGKQIYTTECEGFESECIVEVGSYHIINLSTGERDDNVYIAEEQQPIELPTVLHITNDCDITSSCTSYECPIGYDFVTSSCQSINVDTGESLPMIFNYIFDDNNRQTNLECILTDDTGILVAETICTTAEIEEECHSEVLLDLSC